MKRYRMKDPARQSVIDQAFPEFTVRLQKACAKQYAKAPKTDFIYLSRRDSQETREEGLSTGDWYMEIASVDIEEFEDAYDLEAKGEQ